MKKKYDLAVKTGTYQKDGETKNRYLNVGSVMEDDNGGSFILLDRTFNPAGVPNPDDKQSVLISMFTAKSRDAEPAAAAPASDNDIPF